MPLAFARIERDDGFDPTTTPPWLMVPEGGFKRVRLQGLVGAWTDLTWTFTPADRASIGHLGGDRFAVFGVKPGRVVISAADASGSTARLELSVKPAVTYTIHAYTLVHADGFLSRRDIASVERLVQEANDVLTAQTNLTFEVVPALLPLTLTEHMGRVISSAEHDSVVDALLRWTAGQRVIPVCVARELNIADRPGFDTDAVEYRGTICIEDRIGPRAYVLAHELGHYFGLPHTRRSRALMSRHSPRGKTLYKDEINQMNPAGMH